MKLRNLHRFEATSFAIWFIVLFDASSIGVRDLKRSVTDAALTTASWSTWGPWSDCNTLDTGRQTRSRNCVDSNGRTQSSSSCVGLARRTRQCESCAGYPLLNPSRKPNSPTGSSPSDTIVSSPSFRQTSSKSAWCSSKSFSSGTEYLEFAFKNFVRFTAIRTRGYRGAQSGFIKEFKLKYSYNSMQWFPYTNRAGEVIFKGNIDGIQLRQNKLEPTLVARYIRVYPTSYHSRPCLEVELYGCEYNCGGLITDDFVRIRAPNAAQQTDEPNCLWRIESRVAARLQLKFPYFKLDCRDGMLEIFDGGLPFLDAEHVEAFCGKSRKISSLMFQGSDLWVRFHTNATTDDVGFQLQANVFAVTSLNSSSGEITVPETGGGYAHIHRYLWLIASQEPNATIQLTIHHFISDNKRRVVDKCLGDMLVIFEGDNPASLVGRYCDDDLPKVINSTRGYMRLKFRTRSENPNWKLRFSYKIIGSKPITHASPTVAGLTTALKRPARGTVHSATNRPGNDTNFDATQRKKSAEKSASKVPVIISSVLAVVIAAVFVVALVHYLRRRKAFLKKHPYDCSNRPISHFGDEDSTPFLNTNVLMWSDSNSRNHDKEKPRNGKNSLAFVTVALREDGPQRLSIIPPEMITANSEQSLGNAIDGEDTAGSLVVSDAFTEECMRLLDNNLSAALHEDSSEKFDEQSETVLQHEEEGPNDQDEAFPEVEYASPEVEQTSPEDNDSLPETDEVSSEVSE